MSTANLLDFIGLALGFLLTILVFSYLLGDNPFFRLAIHIFIGVSAAYVALVTINNVLIPFFRAARVNVCCQFYSSFPAWLYSLKSLPCAKQATGR